MLLLASARGISIGAVVLHALVLHALVLHAVMLHGMVLGTMAVLMVRDAGWSVGHVVAGGMRDRSSCEQLHPAPWAASRLVAGDVRVHQAGVADRGRRRAVARSFIPHRGQRPGWSLVTSGCIGQA